MAAFTKDYYKILNLPYNCTILEIKQSYHSLCKLHHPDIGGSENIMQEINEAYSVLANETSRNTYDKWYEQNIVNRFIDAYVFYTDTINVINKQFDRTTFNFDISKYQDDNGFIYIRADKTDNGYHNVIMDYQSWYFTLQSFNNSIEQQEKDKQDNKNESNGSGILDVIHVAAVSLAVITLIVLIVYGISTLLLSDSSNDSQYITYSSTPTPPPPTPTPIPEEPLPKNGFTNFDYNKNSSKNTTIKFESHEDDLTDTGMYYYIKFIDVHTDILKKDLFLHKGQSATIVIPCGDYEIKYVCGDKWYGFEKYFNTNSCYCLEDTENNTAVHTFESKYTYTYTLYGVSDGNMQTTPESIANF